MATAKFGLCSLLGVISSPYSYSIDHRVGRHKFMSMTLRALRIFLVALVLVIPNGMAQEKKEKENFSFGKLQDLEVSMSPVPDPVGTGGKSAVMLTDSKASQDARWLRIDVPFQTKKKITPELKFKFYLEGYEVTEADEGGKVLEKFVILTGEATYRDIPKGEKHFAGIFLPPASMVRFSGNKSNGEMDWSERKLNLRVEAVEAGAPCESVFDLMAEKEKGPSGRGGKKDPDWFKSADAQEVPGALLPVQETPFWPKDFKRYPQPKKS